MKLKKKSNGFTIVELMVTIVAFAILALAVGSMLVYGWMGWRRYVESVTMQRNAMVAMHVIEHRIRNAAEGKVGWNENAITFANDPNFSSTEINPDLDVEVNEFNVSSNNQGGITVSFALETASGTDNNSYGMTIYPRNQ